MTLSSSYGALFLVNAPLSQHLVQRDRQLADALAGGMEHSIGDDCRNSDETGFA